MREMVENLRLKDKVAEVNKDLLRKGLVIHTWGNASSIDRERKMILIKSSGVPFENLKPEDISEVDFEGNVLSAFKPSVDTPIHLEIYKGFDGVGGIVHTHSHYATVFAQAKMDIPCLGTTHADHFNGDIPVIPELSEIEVKENYEANTGKRVVQLFNEKGLNPLDMPAVLLPNHGVLVWGETIDKALENAMILEEVAKLAFETITLSRVQGKEPMMTRDLLGRHYSRKHGPESYYGQSVGSGVGGGSGGEL